VFFSNLHFLIDEFAERVKKLLNWWRTFSHQPENGTFTRVILWTFMLCKRLARDMSSFRSRRTECHEPSILHCVDFEWWQCWCHRSDFQAAQEKDIFKKFLKTPWPCVLPRSHAIRWLSTEYSFLTRSFSGDHPENRN
jgi:hypothetical protein